MSPPPFAELAGLLGALKLRSGQSYETVGRRAHLSRSTTHRYCSGLSISPDFGTLERIAKACGPSDQELAELHRIWSRARSHGRDGAVPDPPAVSAPAGAASAPPTVGRGLFPRFVVALTAAVIAAVMLVAAGDSGPLHPRVSAPVRDFAAPPWSQSPAPVPASLFGVTMNSSTGAMPTFRVGSVRFWDSRTRWANLEPRRGAFDWSILDRLVDGAARSRVPALLTFGGTPAWASPAGGRTPYSDDSRSAPPDNLADWDRFVREVARHYRGRIGAYELWVLGNDPRFYTGTPETLVEMTERASRIIKAADPAATVVCPSFGRLWDTRAAAVMARFAALGGYEHCDVAGVKLDQLRASEPPEATLELAQAIDRTFHRAGIHPPLWSTGTAYEIPLEGKLDPDTAADHAVRFYLTGVYARYDRMYFYNWGGSKIPVVLQVEGSAPTKAALFVEELQRWLNGAEVTSCGAGITASLAPDVWQCSFVSGAERFVIRWTTAGTARMTAGAEMRSVRHLDGSSTAVRAGDPLVIGERPILIALAGQHT
jgi:hypothetical protein